MVANPQLSLKVKIFPGYTPATYTASLSGTDITSYVRLEEGISCSRGAQDETSFPSGGRCSFVLNNRDYRFTPDNTSSSLFPNFKNRLPVRIERASLGTAKVSAVTAGSGGLATATLTTPLAITAGAYITIDGGGSTTPNRGTFVSATTSTSTTSIVYYNAAAVTESYSVALYADATPSVAVWTGFVETIEEHWNGGLQATVQVSASDYFAQYARQKLPTTITGEQLQDSPVALYPLNDDTGSQSSADASGNAQPSLTRATFGVTTSSTTQSQSFVAGNLGSDPDVNTLVCIRHSSTIGYYMTAATTIPAMTAGTIEGYFYLSGGAMNGVLMRVESASNGYAIHANSPATMVQTDLTTATATTRITGTTTVNDNLWHHFALTWSTVSTTTTWTMYVDGVSQGTWAETNAVGLRVQQLSIAGNDSATPATCWASNVAIYNTILSAATLTDRTAAINGYPESSSARFTRLTGISGAAASTSAGGTAAVTMGPQPTNGVGLIEALQAINDAEDGAIYLDARGVTQWIGRDTRDTTIAIITVDPKYLSPATTIMRAPATVNQVIASRPAGGTRTVSDATSIAENGTMTESISLYVTNDADLLKVAQRRFYRRAKQQPRIGNVVVDLTTSTAVNDALLGADIGTYLSIGPLPRGNVDTLLVRIEGISDSITPTSWTRTFTTSPAYNAKSATTWTLGTSVLDYTTTLA